MCTEIYEGFYSSFPSICRVGDKERHADRKKRFKKFQRILKKSLKSTIFFEKINTTSTEMSIFFMGMEQNELKLKSIEKKFLTTAYVKEEIKTTSKLKEFPGFSSKFLSNINLNYSWAITPISPIFFKMYFIQKLIIETSNKIIF